ncbi:MAG: Crp/Fnr family transcriptional regulator [Candidatus Brocadiales bacterium]
MGEKELLVATYKDGNIIVREGAESREMYVIQSGNVKVVKCSGNKETELAVLHEGDLFGEMSLIDVMPRSATVKAVGETKVLAIDHEAFLKQAREDPTFAFTVMRDMGRKIRVANALLSTAIEMLKAVQGSESFLSRTEELETELEKLISVQ